MVRTGSMSTLAAPLKGADGGVTVPKWYSRVLSILEELTREPEQKQDI